MTPGRVPGPGSAAAAALAAAALCGDSAGTTGRRQPRSCLSATASAFGMNWRCESRASLASASVAFFHLGLCDLRKIIRLMGLCVCRVLLWFLIFILFLFNEYLEYVRVALLACSPAFSTAS